MRLINRSGGRKSPQKAMEQKRTTFTNFNKHASSKSTKASLSQHRRRLGVVTIILAVLGVVGIRSFLLLGDSPSSSNLTIIGGDIATLMNATTLSKSQVGTTPTLASSDGAATIKLSTTTAASSSPDFDALQNAQEMSKWRATTEAECNTMLAQAAAINNNKDKTTMLLNEKLRLETDALQKLSLGKAAAAAAASDSIKNDRPIYDTSCQNAFIDLGTNIGDSIGYFIDNAIDVCTPLWLAQYPKKKNNNNNVPINKDFPRPHLNVTDAKLYNYGTNKNNPLFGMLQRQMRLNYNNNNTNNNNTDDVISGKPAAYYLHSEDFCVYGMEGNPTFTNQLQRLEYSIMEEMKPRPVRHLHIHTESVIAAQDGPTKLYLDKLSVQQNFWGSSILSSQQDAVKSGNALNDGQVFAADVQGIRLSTLIKNTMIPFRQQQHETGDSSLGRSGTTATTTSGGLLIIKMDVEGAEYQVLKEVAESGVLCEYIRMGNRVYFIVEYHNRSITDPKQRKREKDGHKAAKQKLVECGVEFGKLQAFWH